jgi:hypothetical protein
MDNREPIKQKAEEASNPFVKPGILTFILSLGIFLLLGLGSTQEVSQNWPKYRCQPHIMPFAGLYGYNAQENIEFCLKTVFLKEAPGVLAPIYEASSSLNSAMSSVGGGLMSVRTTLSGLTDGISSVVRSFNKRIQNIMQVLKGKFGNLQSLMGRVVALLYAIIYSGITALAAGSTFAKGTVGTFLDTFCFPAGTPVLCEDGTYKAIETLKVGDRLATYSSRNVVESTFEFDGSQTQMCSIEGVIVSTNHFVRHNNNWIPAGKHPKAVTAPSHERIYCLNTSLHRFWVRHLLVADFEESEEIAGLVQAEVEEQLNGYSQTDTHESNYNLGMSPDYEVATEKGWLPLRDLAIGTVLVDGGTVRGIVKEGVTEVTTKGFSKAQLVWSQAEGKWKRQHNEPIVNGKQILWQLLTDKNVFHVRMPGVPEQSVRDYAEINDPKLEDMYWTTLMGR